MANVRPSRLLPLMASGCVVFVHVGGEPDTDAEDSGPADSDSDVVDSDAEHTDREPGEVDCAALADLLTWTGPACANAQIYRANADRTAALWVEVGVEAVEVGEVIDIDLGAAAPRGSVRLVVGRRLLGGKCDDVLDPATAPEVDVQHAATRGRVRLRVTDVGADAVGGQTFRADVSLEDVATIDCSVPDVTWPNLSLGWLPG